jgi:hypothetical protein
MIFLKKKRLKLYKNCTKDRISSEIKKNYLIKEKKNLINPYGIRLNMLTWQHHVNTCTLNWDPLNPARNPSPGQRWNRKK